MKTNPFPQPEPQIRVSRNFWCSLFGHKPLLNHTLRIMPGAQLTCQRCREVFTYQHRFVDTVTDM